MKFHKKKLSENITVYIFTKTKNKCLYIRYDARMDFGQDSTSGAKMDDVEIHFKNSFILTDFEEVTINDIPNSIKSILTFLNE